MTLRNRGVPAAGVRRLRRRGAGSQCAFEVGTGFDRRVGSDSGLERTVGDHRESIGVADGPIDPQSKGAIQDGGFIGKRPYEYFVRPKSNRMPESFQQTRWPALMFSMKKEAVASSFLLYKKSYASDAITCTARDRCLLGTRDQSPRLLRIPVLGTPCSKP